MQPQTVLLCGPDRVKLASFGPHRGLFLLLLLLSLLFLPAQPPSRTGAAGPEQGSAHVVEALQAGSTETGTLHRGAETFQRFFTCKRIFPLRVSRLNNTPCVYRTGYTAGLAMLSARGERRGPGRLGGEEGEAA